MKKPSIVPHLIIGICLLASTQLFGQLRLNGQPFYDDNLFVNSERVPFKTSFINTSGRTVSGRLSVYYAINSINPKLIASTQIDSLLPAEQFDSTFYIALDSSIFAGRQVPISYWVEVDSLPVSDTVQQSITMNLRNWSKPKANLFDFDIPSNARFGDTLYLDLKMSNLGTDYFERAPVEVYSMVNNDPLTIDTIYRESRIVKGQERDTLEIQAPLAVGTSAFMPGGGNVVVIWPIGFLKRIDSAVTDTIDIGWPIMVEEGAKLHPASIYPSIGFGDITISSESSKIEEVRITNTNGMSRQVEFTEQTISLHNLAPGSYIITLKMESGGLIQRRIVVLKHR